MKSAYFVLIAIAVLWGCKRKEGCMDPTADNYCADCKKGDPSLCSFSYTMAFWMDTAFGRLLDSLQIDTIFLQVGYDRPDGSYFSEEIGFYTRDRVFSETPSCEDNRLLRYTVRYRLKDMPHTCSGGGLLGGGTRCWIWQYSATHPTKGAVKEGYITIGPGASGCQLIAITR